MAREPIIGAFLSGSLFFVYTEGDGPCVFVGVYRSIEQAVDALQRADGTAREFLSVQMHKEWRRRAGLKEPWQAGIFEVAWGVLALHTMVHHWSSRDGLTLA